MLLVQLVERQKAMGLTDEEFASLLGVSRQLWQMTRTEKQPIGESIVLGVTRQFPDLREAVHIFLQEKANLTSTKAIAASIV